MKNYVQLILVGISLLLLSVVNEWLDENLLIVAFHYLTNDKT
ncbi:hypothetical protein ELOC111193_03575 [Elizabethkingia occulta]